MALWSRWPLYESVLVNLQDGSAFEGVLVDRRGPLLVLANAWLHQQGVEPQGLDGQVYIERRQVSFIQRRG